MDSLSQEQIEYLKDVFEVLDKNHNKKIELSELADGLRAMGMNPTNAEVQDLMNSYDVSGDDALSFNEFVGAYVEFTGKSGSKKSELETLFSELDINKDGKISREELIGFLTRGGEPFDENEINQVFRVFDEDDDGMLSLEELTEALMGR